MITRSQIQRLPWDTIVVVLVSALMVAWIAGFAIGTVVNFFSFN